MKRLILLSVLTSLLVGCSTHAYTDDDRIEDANEFCGYHGYQYIKVFREYGSINAIYCSLDNDVGQAPKYNPLSNPDVPHD